jgi:hypothetical protein
VAGPQASRQRRNRDTQVTGSMACRAFAGRSSLADNIFSDRGAVSFPDCAGKERFACGERLNAAGVQLPLNRSSRS